MVHLDSELRKALLAKADLDELETLLERRGHVSIAQDGRRLVEDGTTTQAELNQACGIVPGEDRPDV